jgi:hypothetical protein
MFKESQYAILAQIVAGQVADFRFLWYIKQCLTNPILTIDNFIDIIDSIV